MLTPALLPLFLRVVAAGGRWGVFGAVPAWKARLLAHEGWTVADGKLKEADR